MTFANYRFGFTALQAKKESAFEALSWTC